MISSLELNKAFCTACNISIACRKTNLLGHLQMVKHMYEMKDLSFKNIDNLLYSDRKKRAEIKLAAFFTA